MLESNHVPCILSTDLIIYDMLWDWTTPILYQLANTMASTVVASKEHQNNNHPRRRRRHLVNKKRVSDEILMASSSGDVAWLEQTLKSNFKRAFTQTVEQVNCFKLIILRNSLSEIWVLFLCFLLLENCFQDNFLSLNFSIFSKFSTFIIFILQ